LRITYFEEFTRLGASSPEYGNRAGYKNFAILEEVRQQMKSQKRRMCQLISIMLCSLSEFLDH